MKNSVLILTVSSWGESKRLRRQLAELLSKDFNVTYVTLPYGLKKPSKSSIYLDQGVRIVEIPGPIFPLRLVRHFLALENLFQRWVLRQFTSKLDSATRFDAIFCFTHDYSEILPFFADSRIIYVANDDHAALALDSSAAQRIAAGERNSIRNADHVLTVSGAIGARLAVHGKPVSVIYPGHNCQRVETPPARLNAAKSACFFGYIDWRLDFRAIGDLLAAGWVVDMIGPVVGTQTEIDVLKAKYPHQFALHPPISTETAPDTLSRYDVLVIPYQFRTARQAEAMELPNKLFVYLCSLRPIVTSWMPNLRLVEPGLVYRVPEGGSFASTCEMALAEDRAEFEGKRRMLADANSWDARREEILAIIDSPTRAASAPYSDAQGIEA